jgi:hypothetical protein
MGKPRRRRSFTPEFKTEIVDDRPVPALAQRGRTGGCVRMWRSSSGPRLSSRTRPGERAPVHRGGESAAAQRPARVSAASGLASRLLCPPDRAVGPRARRPGADRANQGRACRVEGPLRPTAGARRAGPQWPPARPQVDRPADAPHQPRGKAAKRWKRTTIPDKSAAPRPDLIGRDFTARARPSTPGGAGTLPTSPLARGGCIWPPSSTSPPAGSSATPWPITCAPSCPPRRWPTRSPPVIPRPG